VSASRRDSRSRDSASTFLNRPALAAASIDWYPGRLSELPLRAASENTSSGRSMPLRRRVSTGGCRANLRDRSLNAYASGEDSDNHGKSGFPRDLRQITKASGLGLAAPSCPPDPDGDQAILDFVDIRHCDRACSAPDLCPIRFGDKRARPLNKAQRRDLGDGQTGPSEGIG
jgi:hypothetical protein